MFGKDFGGKMVRSKGSRNKKPGRKVPPVPPHTVNDSGDQSPPHTRCSRSRSQSPFSITSTPPRVRDMTPIASPNSRAWAESAERDTTFRHEDLDKTIDFAHGEDDLIPSTQGPRVKKHLNMDVVQEMEPVKSDRGEPSTVRGRRSDASNSSDQEGSVNVRRKRSDISMPSSEEGEKGGT